MYFLIINIIIHQAPEKSSDQLFSSMVAHCLPLLPSNSGDVRATIIIGDAVAVFTYFILKDICEKTEQFLSRPACSHTGWKRNAR